MKTAGGFYKENPFRLGGTCRIWIKKEIPVHIELKKVIADGEDITDLVKELE
jgi:hypothetical protein